MFEKAGEIGLGEMKAGEIEGVNIEGFIEGKY